eukprot:938363-Rhodomonas_salina.1
MQGTVGWLSGKKLPSRTRIHHVQTYIAFCSFCTTHTENRHTASMPHVLFHNFPTADVLRTPVLSETKACPHEVSEKPIGELPRREARPPLILHFGEQLRHSAGVRGKPVLLGSDRKLCEQ